MDTFTTGGLPQQPSLQKRGGGGKQKPEQSNQPPESKKDKMRKRLGMNMDRNQRSRLWRAVIAEYVGTTIFVFMACGSVVVQQVGGTATVAQNLLAGIVQGFAIAVLVYALAKTSGGHVNPAVTTTLMFGGGMPIISGLLYIAAQCVGGITGAALISGVLPDPIEGDLGTTTIHHISRFQAFVFEMIVTFLLCFAVLATGMDPDGDGVVKGLAPIPIGFAVVVGVSIAFAFTGGSLNPARTLGPAVVSHTWESHYIYWAGPMAGALLAALLFRVVFRTKPQDTEDHQGEQESKRHETGEGSNKNPPGDANV